MMIEIQYTIATYNLNERFLRLNKNLESLLKYSKKMMKRNFHLIKETREQSKLAGYLRSDNEARNVGRAIRTTKISDWITNDGDGNYIFKFNNKISMIIIIFFCINRNS